MNPAQPGKPWVFVANERGIVGLRMFVDAGHSVPAPHVGWKPVTSDGSSPIVANGVLYYLGSGGIKALRATDGMYLWLDTQALAVRLSVRVLMDSGIQFAVPVR